MSSRRRWRIVFWACFAWAIFFSLVLYSVLWWGYGVEDRRVYHLGWLGIAFGLYARHKAGMDLNWSPLRKRQNRKPRAQ